tara:strand:- start:792 stop:1763 length:972 start_codon:yes stop_codon:yes gene_type:complete
MKNILLQLLIFTLVTSCYAIEKNKNHEKLDSLRNKVLFFKNLDKKDSIKSCLDEIKKVVESMSSEELFEYEYYDLIKIRTVEKQLEISKSKSQMQSLVLLLICILSFIYLIRFTDKKSREEQIKKLNAASKISSYELELKRRISERLHDDIGGSIAALKMQLSKNKNLENETKVINAIYNDIRILSQDLDAQNKLYPSIQISAQDLVQEMCTNFEKTTLNIFPEKEIEKINNQVLNQNIILTLKELITNTIKHANAKNISIDISKQENEIIILVQDDGIGFDFTKKEGQGLKSIRNRCVLNEGELFIDSNKKNGTTITVNYKI